MKSKEIVQDVLRRMPDDASLNDIAEELRFIAAVQEGLAELDSSKDSVSIEQVQRELPSWVVTIRRRRRGRQKQNSTQKQTQHLTKTQGKNEKQVTR